MIMVQAPVVDIMGEHVARSVAKDLVAVSTLHIQVVDIVFASSSPLLLHNNKKKHHHNHNNNK